MKKILIVIMTYYCSLGYSNGAVRDATMQNNTPSRVATTRPQRTQTVSNTTTHTSRPEIPVSTTRASARTTARTATTTTSRAINARTSGTPVTISRSTNKTIRGTTSRNSNLGRSAVSNTPTNTFNGGYNACRDAYFTCMDQFCAKQNDSYRRCICSSRLSEIQTRERALSQSANNLQDFKDLNMDAISKTAAEVKSMISATVGEKTMTNTKDTSDSSKKLSGISAVLSTTKKNSLSTTGTIDIAGDINAIWATTDLTSGANIANLTGEHLYNAVHAQCSELVANSCPSASTFKMVASAYGMYIENDCTALSNALDKNLIAANSSIRETGHMVETARLENYNSHNSNTINQCIALVRTDITQDTACGDNYIHCLDITGKYLNRTTGEPIYTPDFYKLENQISISSNILSDSSNRLVISELERMRDYASASLDTCHDIADEVWDEFLRQALAEIYQKQQERIRTVKEECLEVVNTCYDDQSQSLRDFSNLKDNLLRGQRLELSEQMCKEKLDTCSNLYGDLATLVETMHNITSQKIAVGCQESLQEFLKTKCTPPSNDTLHSYPFACRNYAPGSNTYAQISDCNKSIFYEEEDIDNTILYSPITGYTHCVIKYVSCNQEGYTPINGKCVRTGTSSDSVECGDYLGSLYQQVLRYAMQTCVRPSQLSAEVIPATILADVNAVMDTVRKDMSTELSRECERLNGIWISNPWKSGDETWPLFDMETNSNKKWGFCTPMSNSATKSE